MPPKALLQPAVPPPRALPSFLAFAPPLLDQEELLQLKDTLDSGWLTRGPKCERFESACKDLLRSDGTLAVSSCTAALHLGLLVLNVGPGDAVVTTPLTFASTAHVIMYTGARPLFCDVNPSDGNLSLERVRELLANQCNKDRDGLTRHDSTGLTVKAVLPVHYGGFPADVTGFRETAGAYGLNILEDAAHAFAALTDRHQVGSSVLQRMPRHDLSALTAFSFYATKNVACGEGGLLTGPEPLIRKAAVLSAYGITDERKIWERHSPRATWDYDVSVLGWKYNFTDLGAALGLAQLKKLPEMQSRRRAFAKIWTSALSSLDGKLVTLPKESSGSSSAWHLYPLRLIPENLSCDRNSVIDRLRELNIGTSVMFRPLHLFSYYARTLGLKEGDFPEAESFFLNEISLPMSPANPMPLVEEAAETLRRLLLSLAR
ncbi:MAG: DegT/DnrJ/EryC1/StrS aminotransferase family protein [Deltaproteobacteria bacterium]|jgi:dTDP-4-amino-4,6-dideoxygalactose transaminase|nr:DegT/DnrJ/EryC1/StrS aminotransferase family protein [Deltaproteobacteria bacterium]